jgi:hypothetical protein
VARPARSCGTIEQPAETCVSLSGQALVWPDVGGIDAGQDARSERRGYIVEMLTDPVAYLRSQLDQERQAHAEARRIIGGLVQRVPELKASDQEGLPEARESPESPGPSRAPTA